METKVVSAESQIHNFIPAYENIYNLLLTVSHLSAKSAGSSPGHRFTSPTEASSASETSFGPVV